MAHAELSPSSAVRWMSCPGSVAACRGLPDTSSKYADEGTDAHALAAACLESGADAAQAIGGALAEGTIVSADMATHVQTYVDYVRQVVAATRGELLIEQRLPISHITGEEDAHGTADAVILAGSELIVVDLKFGRGYAVLADNNPQLQIYALAALAEFGLVGDFTAVRMVIHQPRLGVVSEWVQTVEDLEAFGAAVLVAAERTRQPDAPLVVSEAGCHFCKAKADCPAIREQVMSAFHDVDPEVAEPNLLAAAMGQANLIEGWLKAIRAKVESNLLAQIPVPGWKLVQGKRGNRAWKDSAQAEALLKEMRIKHDLMYDYSVISPTSADKLAKEGVIGPRQWPKVQALITQADGKPSVAPESDKRPALVTSAVGDFDDVTNLS
jgi:hypothetical protein